MEQTYRRRSAQAARASQRRRENRKGMEWDKETIGQQSAVCILFFLVAMVVKMLPDPALEFTRNSIHYVLTQDTDWGGTITNAKNFIMENVFQKPQTQESLDPLGSMTAPADGEIISGFGMRTDPSGGGETFHYGVDFAGEAGEKIKCAAEGIVQEVGYSEELGNYISVKHGEKIFSLYGHCDRILATEGDAIGAGQVIATMGNSGKTSAPMLHFEIREGDASLDPSVFIN